MDQTCAAPDVALAAQTLGKDLLAAVADELNRTEWALKPPLEQEQALARLRAVCSDLMSRGLQIMFSGGYPACEAIIDSVTVKKGLKVGVRIAKGTRHWPEVVEAEGQKILLVMADPDVYRANMEDVKARANQGDLFNGTYEGTKEFRRDEQPAAPAKSWADVTGEPIEEPIDRQNASNHTKAALDAVHVDVDIAKIDLWSEAECACAYEWAMAFASNPDSAPARPWWLPQPSPPEPVDDPEVVRVETPEQEATAA